MDPDATLAELMVSIRSLRRHLALEQPDRDEAVTLLDSVVTNAVDLRHWLLRGGYVPRLPVR